MKIAVIGSGISGLTCAHLLSRSHEVHLFEADSRLGGHTHTVDVTLPSGTYPVDTGFIVFNDWTYPNFIRLMDQLKVQWQDSSMSFSVKDEISGLEYNGTTLNSLFAQRRNLFRPSFHRMIRDILRFNREAPPTLLSGSTLSLGDYLKKNHYSEEFKKHYIIPMGAAIWSSSAAQMEEFPVEFFIRFFKNHGMLSVDDRPVWKVLKNGSRSYLEPITQPFRDRIQLNSKVVRVQREPSCVNLTFEQAGSLQAATFDHVVFASHSDQTLQMLENASELERNILSSFAYQPNSTLLHTDLGVLPKKKLAWAAWNYFVPKINQEKVAVTYQMNILQNLSAPETLNVSLNMDQAIDPAKIIKKINYHHPVYSREAFQAQNQWHLISNEQNRTHFCGAYWGYGFHEDGVKSGLRVAESFGERL